MNTSMTHTIGAPQQSRNGDVTRHIASLDVRDAVYHTAHDYPGGVPALALRMGRSPNTLQHQVSLTNTTHHLAIEDAVKVQELSGDFRILYAMAASLGHVAVRVDTESEVTMECLRRLCKEFADTLSAITEADADGSITRNEFLRCEREASELIGAVNSAIASLRGRIPGGML